MTISSELFYAYARDAEKILHAHGFTMTHNAQKNSSRSLTAEYTKADEVFLFSWDAAQQSLGVIHKRESQLQELLYRGLRNANMAECERALHDAMNVLVNYFTAHTHDDDDENSCGCAHHHA